MISTTLSRVHRWRDVARKHSRKRDESGLTTLEWLLIVAAVAGLAALAVVLVQSTVGETADQISGSSARETASKLAAEEIMDRASEGKDDQPLGAKSFGEWSDHYNKKCDRLNITYGDAGIKAHPNFTVTSGEEGKDVVVADITPGDVKAATDTAVAAGDKAVAECRITT